MMSIVEKQSKVSEFSNLLQTKNFVLICENKGLQVAHFEQIRKLGREKEIIIKVMKNSLLKHSFNNFNFNNIEAHLVGQNLFIVGDDELSAAKLIDYFIKSTKLIDFKAAYMQKKEVNITTIKEIALIESREQILSKLVYLLQQVSESK